MLTEEILKNHDQEVRTHFWRNYLAHGIEGGLFIGGLAFVSASTLLPRMVQQLGGGNWLIGLAPVIQMLGFTAPGIFTASRIERLHRMKPLLMALGILQRLAFLVAGCLLFFVPNISLAAALATVMLAPLVSGIMGGLMGPAWNEFVAKTVPNERRASLWAIRFTLASVIGVGAGLVVHRVLDSVPGVKGYGILHLLCFAFMALSYVVIAQVRETTFLPPKKTGPPEAWDHLFWRIPHILRSYPDLARYLYSRLAAQGTFLVLSFMGIHALERLGAPDSFLGRLLSWQMGSMILGTFWGGWQGDRKGGKSPLMLGGALAVLAMAWSAFAASETAFIAIFALQGLAGGMSNVGVPTLNLELAPVQERVAISAVNGWFSGAGMVMAFSAGLARDFGVSYAFLAYAGAACVLGSLYLLSAVNEPRGGTQPPVGVATTRVNL
jgi:MFS family permease